MTASQIRQLRRGYGMTQEMFAHLLGTTQASLSAWETGKREPSRVWRGQLQQAADKLRRGQKSKKP